VTQSGGLLSINTYKDAANNGNWATGGVCQCAIAQTYGAYFVRSEITGPGDDNDEMLWPAQHVWPPEVDFNESTAGTQATDAFVHYNSDNEQIGHQISIDLTKWHTWGVIWTPTQVIFTIDGHTWGDVTDPSAIPHIPMTLDLQEQTYCGTGWACPTQPVSMKVDWVAEFALLHP
jgi:beta-glucanase (GH16 family)